MLGVVITTALYHNHPDLPEGQLAKLRASVVNMRALADVARAPRPGGLGPYLLLGKGEEATGGRDKASILADTLEALLGAIYLQYGLDTAAEVIHRLFDPLMAEVGRPRRRRWTGRPACRSSPRRSAWACPSTASTRPGPDHAKTFTAWVVVAGDRYGGVAGPQQEGGRAAGRRGRLAGAVRARPEAGSGADGVPDDSRPRR